MRIAVCFTGVSQCVTTCGKCHNLSPFVTGTGKCPNAMVNTRIYCYTVYRVQYGGGGAVLLLPRRRWPRPSPSPTAVAQSSSFPDGGGTVLLRRRRRWRRPPPLPTAVAETMRSSSGPGPPCRRAAVREAAAGLRHGGRPGRPGPEDSPAVIWVADIVWWVRQVFCYLQR